MTEYILFCGQEANFQTRSFLIPINDLPEKRKKDFELLRQYAQPVDFGSQGKVDSVLFQNIIFDGNSGRHEKLPYTDICSQLTHFADWGSEYADEEDEKWLDKCIYHPCSRGFNHVKNYLSAKSRNKYNIVEGFLVLEKTNDQWNPPMYDDPEEMYEKLYGLKVN